MKLLTAACMFAVVLSAAASVANASVVGRAPASRALLVNVVHSMGSSVEWPQFGFDAAHDGFNPHEKTLTAANIGQLQQAWSFPVVSGNVGHVVEANGIIYAPTTTGTLYALDAASGAELWSYATGTGYATSGSVAAVDKGMVFVPCADGQSTQAMCALDAATGVLHWAYSPGGGTSVATPAVVSDHTVFFGLCQSTCSYVAINEKGQRIWGVGNGATCAVNGGLPPAVSGDALYAGIVYKGSPCTVSAVEGWNTKTGQVLFSPSLAYPLFGLAVAGSIVYTTFFQPSSEPSFQIEFVDYIRAGSGTWGPNTGFDFEYPEGYTSQPSIAYGLMYAPMYRTFSSSVFSLNAFSATKSRGDSVKSRWSTRGWSSYVSVANHLLYSSCPGALPCVWDAKSGGQLLGLTPNGSLYPGPALAIVNGVVYGACNGSNVCAWTLPSMIRRRR